MPDITVDAHVDSFMANAMSASNKTTLKARLEAENAGAAAAAQAAAEATAAADATTKANAAQSAAEATASADATSKANAAQAAAEATAAAELSNAGIDTASRELDDASGITSVEWDSRRLVNVYGSPMLEWDGNFMPVPIATYGLQCGGNGNYGSLFVDDGSGTFTTIDPYGIFDYSYNYVIDTYNHALYDGFNAMVLDFNVAYNSYNAVYCDTDFYVNGTTTLSTVNIAFGIYDGFSTASIEPTSRYLQDSSGTQVFDWSNSAKMVASVPIQFPTDGFIMQSPDATLWAVTIDNSGVISTTSLP